MKIETIVVGPIETNSYLLVDGEEMILIDPGDEAVKIIKKIEEQSADLKMIVLTHYHYDHVLAAKKISELYKVPIMIHKADEEYLELTADDLLSNEIHFAKTKLEVIHTPGHTPGSVCLKMNDDLLFSGDTIFADGIGRTDFPGGSKEEIMASLKKLKNIIKPGTKVYPGHGNPFIYNDFKK